MSNIPFDFMVAPTASTPRTLLESIRQVSNASAGFCRSWLAQEISDALTTSEEAFELLDHIQNELLRHRDKHSKLPNWSESPFNIALNVNIGFILDPASAVEKAEFIAQEPGCAAMPSGSSTKPLTLVAALNKLKHRDTSAVNFTVSSVHTLFIFTHAGMNKPDTISSFGMQSFCDACKVAAQSIPCPPDH